MARGFGWGGQCKAGGRRVAMRMEGSRPVGR